MNYPPSVQSRVFAKIAFMLLAAMLTGPAAVRGQGLRVGAVVNTNFSTINRFLWTNHLGRVFTPGNSTVRLSDFDGRILFMEFFAVW